MDDLIAPESRARLVRVNKLRPSWQRTVLTMYRRQFVSPLLKRPVEASEKDESLLKRARLNISESLSVPESRTPLLNLQVPNYSPTGREAQTEGYWNVLWRNQTTKKNKTWDGDGVLSLEDGFLTLRDSDGKKY